MLILAGVLTLPKKPELKEILMNSKILFTTTAAVLLVALAPVANAATIQIQYQVGSGPITTCGFPSPGPVTCLNVAGPPLRIIGLDANSNNPGNSSLGVLTSDDVDLINNSTESQQLQIQISEDGFAAPVGTSGTLLSHIGGTVITGSIFNSLSFQSCVDPGNNLKPVGSFGVACVPPGTLASGLSAPPITAVGSFSSDKNFSFASLTGPYSIQESFVISLGAGAEINWSASTSVAAATTTTPEPASAFLFLGAGLVSLGAFRRKWLILRK
jgi:hypothetical protein